MRQVTRIFLFGEGSSFVVAGLSHFGVLVKGYEHRQAAIAESTIAAVLLIGCGLTLVLAAQTRAIGIAVQSFALLGTLVGAFTIAIGVGPRTVPDIIYHIAIVVVLVGGLLLVVQAPAADMTWQR
jgi:peptidoglycan/LPS O-acetylase OafA/YrhL